MIKIRLRNGPQHGLETELFGPLNVVGFPRIKENFDHAEPVPAGRKRHSWDDDALVIFTDNYHGTPVTENGRVIYEYEP